MRPLPVREDREIRPEPESLPELLHQLQQPLTALHCVLEMGLIKRRSSEEYRTLLQNALAETDRVLSVAAMIRDRFPAQRRGSA
jgi:hypothetical protein